MKATELIEELQKQIKRRGDCDVYYSYDGGMRVVCEDVTFHRNFTGNEHSDCWPNIKKGFIINNEA